MVLGCTPQASEACTHPASRLKKQPGVSDRDIHGLIDRWGSYIWSKVLERHPLVCTGQRGRTWQQSWLLGVGGGYRGN